MSKSYNVEIPLDGNPTPLVLARCTEPEHAAELVRVLLEHASVESVTVRVERTIQPPAPF